MQVSIWVSRLKRALKCHAPRCRESHALRGCSRSNIAFAQRSIDIVDTTRKYAEGNGGRDWNDGTKCNEVDNGAEWVQIGVRTNSIIMSLSIESVHSWRKVRAYEAGTRTAPLEP